METYGIEQINDVYSELLKRTGVEDLLSTLLLANRRGTLDEMLKSVGQEDLLADLGLVESTRVKKVVVLGESSVKERKLKQFAEEYCPSSKGYEFEYKLTYNLKRYDFRKMQNNDSYLAVLVGPMPHSTGGKGGSSSAIAEMENHPEYWPHVIRLRNESGKLVITNNSFKEALQELLAYQATL